MVKLTPDLDLNEVKQEMGDFAKLSVNDDLKIDWDDKKLVVFHFFRNEGETCTIRVWDIENEPRFEYFIDKGTEYITDKVFVHDGHIVVGKWLFFIKLGWFSLFSKWRRILVQSKFNIENKPGFEYFIDKDLECITDKVFVYDGHFVVGMLV